MELDIVLMDVSLIELYTLLIYEGRVGIGTENPVSCSKMHVDSHDNYAAYLTSDYQSYSNTFVSVATYTGGGNNQATAVFGQSEPAGGYGYGGYFKGGYRGVYAKSTMSGSCYRYGVYGYAGGGSTNYAIYGYAYGGTN